jgi:hypothetical protein
MKITRGFSTGRLLGATLALAALTGAVAQANDEKLAKHLHKLNPAALVGGKSIVGTKPGQQLHGVHGKPNFIIALGDEETIHGASANDEIGAIGKGVKLVPSNHGHSYIAAGPDSEVVVTGKGHNLIVSHAKGATIILESPSNEVIANGAHDKIVCAKHSSHELIEVAKGEQVSKSCKGHHDTIAPVPKVLSAHSSAARAHAAAECNLGSVGDCTVTATTRTLDGLWDSDRVPAGGCLSVAGQVLVNHVYQPGTLILRGIEVKGLTWIAVDIGEPVRDPQFGTGDRVTGNEEGAATNWSLNPESYTVIYHCTTDLSRGYS